MTLFWYEIDNKRATFTISKLFVYSETNSKHSPRLSPAGSSNAKTPKWLNTCIIIARIGVKLDANKKNSVYKGNSLRTISWFRALNLQTLDKKEVIHLFLFLFTLQLLPVLHLTLCPKCLWVGSSSSLLLISKLIFFPLDFRYIRLLFVWHFVLIWKCFCILFYVQLDVGALYF